MMRRVWTALAVAALLTGCGSDSGSTDTSDSEVETTVPTGAIYSLAVDPGDGTMYLTVGERTHRLASGSTTFETIDAAMTNGGDSGTVKDLVLRFTGPGKFVASGHAVAPPLAANVGFIRSDDGAAGWTSVSGYNEADYHEIEVVKDQIVGLRSDSPGVRVSRDGGKTFDTHAPPGQSASIDSATNPADLDQIAISSEQGVFVSSNGGRSWRQRDTTSATRLAWPAEDAFYSAGLDGKIRVSTDQGRSWKETGTLGAGPKEFTFGLDGELLAVMADGEIRRSTDGGLAWSTVAKPQL